MKRAIPALTVNGDYKEYPAPLQQAATRCIVFFILNAERRCWAETARLVK